MRNRPQVEIADLLEVPRVASEQWQVLADSRCGNEDVVCAGRGLATRSPEFCRDSTEHPRSARVERQRIEVGFGEL